MLPTERTPLTRANSSPDYVEFASLLRTRRSRIRQFQCCVCAAFIILFSPIGVVLTLGRKMPSTESLPLTDDKPARVYYVQDTHQFYSRQRREHLQLRCFIYAVTLAVFTMALIVTVSYSVSHDTIDTKPNLTDQGRGPVGNLTKPLKLSASQGSGPYNVFIQDSTPKNSKFMPVSRVGLNSSATGLSPGETREGLLAGNLAIERRLSADAIALASPLPAPSPESRHRYAVSTCPCVSALALAAVGELAATKKIESSRSILGEPSAIGSYFDGSWLPRGGCKELNAVKCHDSKYRTYDGTCNRLKQWGAAMTPYIRTLPPNYADGLQEPRRALSGKELPSARELSLKVHKPSPSSNPSFTVMLAVYGQFLDHDITATAISLGVNGTSLYCCPPAFDQHPECFPVRVASGDPVYDLAGRTCMNFVRSAPAPQCKLGPRQQLNQVSAFIDASTVYGSSQDNALQLRELAGGRLRMQLTPDNRTLLPPSTNPNDGCNREAERLRGRYCFAAGDARANENLHLTTMHLLWARQHNRIAGELARINPTWSDEILYHEARSIVGAQMQHITYNEFVPIIIGEQESKARGLRPLKSGYRPFVEDPEGGTNPSIANHFSAAAFRFAHTLLPGLMMVTDTQKGTSSYVELHRMLFNPYSLYAQGGVESSVTSATSNVIQMTSTHVTSQLTAHLFEDPIGNTTVPCGLDLVSLNIQRGRDHGLPGYTSWREYCGLGKVASFADLQGHLDPQVLQQISLLYESVHDIDLYSGALAEVPKSGGIVGPTFTCLIAEQFARLQRGDRFWYEVPNQPHSFTESQLAELRKTSLAKVICDCSDGVTQVQAEVMRSVGPDNPMVSCEDIPGVSFESWKDDASSNVMNQPDLGATLTPVDWMALKTNINDTIRDIITYINGTFSSPTLVTTDWMEFRNYINGSFNDLKDQLNALHPPVPVEALRAMEKMSMNGDSFILRAAAPPGIAQDWINFKIDLIKSLKNSVGAMASAPPDPAEWIAFKQNIINQISDLRRQVSAMNTELAPELLMERYKQEQAQMSKNNFAPESEPTKESALPLSAIFDWKDFQDDTIESLDDAILEIGEELPEPGDPAWASFGPEIKDRFDALRDKINMDRSTPPSELASNPTYEASQSAGQRPTEKTPYGNYNILGLMATDDASKAAMNFTVDWLEFRDQINDTLTRIIADIKTNKPTALNPSGWTFFMNNTKNDFAELKNNIARIKAEWLAKLGNVTKATSTTARSAVKAAGKLDKLDKPLNSVPSSEWADFKKQINDTLMDIINGVKSEQKIDIPAVHAEFNASFAELRNEIASLRDIIVQNLNSSHAAASPEANPADFWKAQAAKWASFRTNLNSTISDLLGGLKNESAATIAEVMKILFQTKDKVAALDPPEFYPTGMQPPPDWPEFIASINKTVADSLDTVSNLKTTAQTLRTLPPQVSSSSPLSASLLWLIVPFTLTYCNTHSPRAKLKITARC